jgi:hypothetical protein
MSMQHGGGTSQQLKISGTAATGSPCIRPATAAAALCGAAAPHLVLQGWVDDGAEYDVGVGVHQIVDDLGGGVDLGDEVVVEGQRVAG